MVMFSEIGKGTAVAALIVGLVIGVPVGLYFSGMITEAKDSNVAPKTKSAKSWGFAQHDPEGKYLETSAAHAKCINVMMPKGRGYTHAHTIADQLGSGTIKFETIERVYQNLECDVTFGPLPKPRE